MQVNATRQVNATDGSTQPGGSDAASRSRPPAGQPDRARLLDVLSALFIQPLGLSVDVWEAHPATPAPGAYDRAGVAPEVGDHFAAAATRHTLPRPVRPVRMILAVALLAVHEPMTLAFRA
jgi:hypothetical protein